MTRVLLHICCGPCALYPLSILRDDGLDVEGFFHNPNIHPFQEFQRRLEAVEQVARARDLLVHYERRYGLTEYLRAVVFHEQQRCTLCYEMRLLATVQAAKRLGADAFSTTLLYSKYQRHDLIRQTAERLAREHGIPFYYLDFREGWSKGIELSKRLGLYRQPYCGCIYSEQERYDQGASHESF